MERKKGVMLDALSLGRFLRFGVEVFSYNHDSKMLINQQNGGYNAEEAWKRGFNTPAHLVYVFLSYSALN